LIHELTGPAIPAVLPGIHSVRAVDESGVHPLLLAIGSERYTPYADERIPQELLTNANAILGQGQLSLAKYLFIVAYQDDSGLDINDTSAFFRHVLARVDWARDLHFQTRTTIDTLDYSGTGLNEGSKLVVAAAGRTKRTLPVEIPPEFTLPAGFSNPRICLPGVLSVAAQSWDAVPHGVDDLPRRFCAAYTRDATINRFPLILLVDDSDFCAASLSNFLWVTFTRSNPAADIYGIDEFIEQKHWGCHGSLVVDARIKSHMAPPLEADPTIAARVDKLFAHGGPLHGMD
jgi:4-hydroxy-3-polyprenylbenzoate decarboxylase